VVRSPSYDGDVLASDTSAEARRVQVEVARRQPAGERFRQAAEMSAMVVRIAGEGIRRRHPEYDDEQAVWALRRVQLGDQLFQEAWPEAPLLDP
jgi:hypothetical protein